MLEIAKRLRTNDSIRAKEVRLVGDKGEQLGIIPLYRAREIARKDNLDLVEVAPAAVPPVCRLMDYGRFLYEQTKKEREARKGQKTSLIREVRIRPKIGEHDIQAKLRTTRKLLEEGNKVKVSILFRGREITHPELAMKLLQRVADTMGEDAVYENKPVMYGRRMIAVMAPTNSLKAKIKEKVQETDAQTKNP